MDQLFIQAYLMGASNREFEAIMVLEKFFYGVERPKPCTKCQHKWLKNNLFGKRHAGPSYESEERSSSDPVDATEELDLMRRELSLKQRKLELRKEEVRLLVDEIQLSLDELKLKRRRQNTGAAERSRRFSRVEKRKRYGHSSRHKLAILDLLSM